jgi:hypothetical protein
LAPRGRRRRPKARVIDLMGLVAGFIYAPTGLLVTRGALFIKAPEDRIFDRH